MSNHHYTTKEKRIKKLRYAAIVLAVLLFASSALLFIGLWERHNNRYSSEQPSKAESVVEYNGQKYKLRKNIETVLILGLDKYESGSDTEESYNNDKQSDFMMLLVIDHEAEKCSALHINRDTVAEMNILGVAGDKVGTVSKQIALAHTYGNGKEVSCRNSADAVSALLNNIQIDRYISVTMDAVPTLVDYVGGVEVDVLDDFTGIDDTLVMGEKVNLTGEQALTYVRTRYGLEDSSNSRRMERQRQFIEALYAKALAKSKENSNFAVNAGAKLSEFIVSDYSGNALQKFAEKIMDYQFNDILALEGKYVEGEKHMEFYPDKASVDATVISLFYEQKG
ncbi:MAG: LCP family protein [Clostridia bacterium]|nr:LCP family protein [Clostridia bacterium]